MPKKIILLADGTGNSAASPFKTNVWRLYQAIEQGPDQVAWYDDGVGTETYKPLAAFSGAFGLGVWKNVKSLYAFLCRNYVSGDDVYLFGFSRGAFTVRLLAGLIARCGVVKTDTEDALRIGVQKAYGAYRRDFLYRATGSPRRRVMRWLRLILKRPDYEPNRPDRIALGQGIEQYRARIKFIGVWDTVDAYGMPVDEWKRGIDRIVWPMTVADRELSPDIVRARHALSLDDERITFRPVLWNEARRDGRQLHHPGQLLQAWFAGVHANVGGGYPDDGLAYVALDWMMSETDIRFLADHRTEIAARANPNGKQSDSRAGLAGYYRYGPRKLEQLCHDPWYGVRITHPLIHESAVKRVGTGVVPCAPVSVPPSFHVVPTGTAAALAEEWMKLAWDQVWWRNVAYLCTALLTLVLVLFPLLEWLGLWGLLSGWIESSRVCNAAPSVCAYTKLAILSGTRLLHEYAGSLTSVDFSALVANFAPAWSRLWVSSYMQYPLIAVVLAALLAWLFFRKSGKIQEAIFDRAERAWWNMKHTSPPPPPRPRISDRIARVLRTRLWLLHELVDEWMLPFLFGIGTALFIVFLSVITFPFSLIAIYRFWSFLRGTDVSTRGMGQVDPDPIPARLLAFLRAFIRKPVVTPQEGVTTT